jgi:transcriptional regulator GlxA family with amidase domain
MYCLDSRGDSVAARIRFMLVTNPATCSGCSTIMPPPLHSVYPDDGASVKSKTSRDVLYVIDGRIATSAGIASGIDLALHLIAVRDGPAVAARAAREMVVYARLNGDEQQASAMLRHRSHLSDTAHRAQDHIEARFAGPLPLTALASKCGISQRTLTRKFAAATGQTPLRYQQLLRLERAEHLIGHGATVEAAARAVGFQDARVLRRLRARRPA